MENYLDSAHTIDAERTIEYELPLMQLLAMEPSTDSVANGADDGASQPRSVAYGIRGMAEDKNS